MALLSHKAASSSCAVKATGEGLCRASSCPAKALCKRSSSLLFREGEGLGGLSVCMLQSISKHSGPR